MHCEIWMPYWMNCWREESDTLYDTMATTPEQSQQLDMPVQDRYTNILLI